MTDQPIEHVDFDLDSLETEGDEQPFVVTWTGGKTIHMQNPQLIPWQELAEADESNPLSLLEIVITDDDEWEHVLNTPLSAEKLGKAVERYMKHFGLGAPGKLGAGLRGRSRGIGRR